MLLKRSLEKDRVCFTALTFLVGSRERTWGKLCPTVKQGQKGSRKHDFHCCKQLLNFKALSSGPYPRTTYTYLWSFQNGEIVEYSKLQEAEAMHLCNSFLSKEKEKGKEVHMNSCSQEEPGDLQRQLKGKSMWTLQSPEDQHCRRATSHLTGAVTLVEVWSSPDSKERKQCALCFCPACFLLALLETDSVGMSQVEKHIWFIMECAAPCCACKYLKNSFITISLINKVHLKI